MFDCKKFVFAGKNLKQILVFIVTCACYFICYFMRGCYERIHFFEAISCAIGSNKYFRCIINFLHVAPIGYFGNWLHNFREINKDFTRQN